MCRRHGSRERLLSRVCGTVPYAAPEVLEAPSRPYRAPPADVWSAALVLLAMLAGGQSLASSEAFPGDLAKSRATRRPYHVSTLSSPPPPAVDRRRVTYSMEWLYLNVCPF